MRQNNAPRAWGTKGACRFLPALLLEKEAVCVIPTVLLYNLENDKGRQIKSLCLPLKIRARSVLPEDFSQPLEAVLGEAARRETEAPQSPFSQEMVVMAGLSSQQMHQFLQGFRRKKIPPVALKAVLTATNQKWDAFQLCRELSLERETMERGENLHEGKAL